MKIILKHLATILCLALILIRVAVLLFDYNFQFDGFAIGLMIWNIVPLGLLALISIFLDKSSHHIYPLLATVILVGSLTVLCSAPAPGGDGQGSLIWLFLPVWELILSGVTFVIGFLIYKLLSQLLIEGKDSDLESEDESA